MATTHGVLPARTVLLEPPCPACGNPLTIYLFVHTVDTERRPGAIAVNLKADHLIGPHACCTIPVQHGGEG